jgi:hypothetical protein
MFLSSLLNLFFLNLGPITKRMQNDHLTYFNLMEMIKDKTNILKSWTFQTSSASGASLFDYLELTKNGTFGAFQINLGNREKFSNDCRDHVNRLLEELPKRFSPSIVQENLSILFDPQYLIHHKKDISSPEYGRTAIDFLRKKYKRFISFDFNFAHNEWDSIKPGLSDYVHNLSTDCAVKEFWKNFILLKQTTNTLFDQQYKNILLLLDIYLISPTNSAECERGVC